ncbi:MAG: DUF3846 domain-containing protein [Prevotella sp.]|nr:DUF3846 domain-containing protein [Prevotella sp.]
MNSYIIKADGAIVPYSPANGKSFTLREMQNAVGGYIERVGTHQNKSVWANEEGRLKGLPVNEKASELCYREIVGDVLVCNEELVK